MPVKEKPFIKIPLDFRDLHDLKELVDNYEFVAKLAKALNNYQEHYIDSLFMTLNDLLEYIPEDQHKQYKVYTRKEIHRQEDYNFKLNKNVPISLAKTLIEATKDENYDWSDKPKRKKRTKTHEEPIFLVDNINKRIQICFWNHPSKEDCDITYKKREFIVKAKEKILIAKIHYETIGYQTVGGCLINRGCWNEYHTGGTTHEYIKNGYELHHFCTRTNQYLGYFGKKEDKDRPWIEKTSRY